MSLRFSLEGDADVSGIVRGLKQISSASEETARQVNAALGGTVKKVLDIEVKRTGNGESQIIASQKEILSNWDKIASEIRKVEKLEAGSVTSLRQQVNQAKQARDEISRYSESVGALGGKVRTVNDAWAAQNTKVQQLQRSLDLATASGFWDRAKASLNAGGLINFANGLTQITNGLQSASIVIGQVTGSVNSLINALGDLQSFRLAFEAVGQGAGGANLALAESSRIASGLGVDLKTTRNSFQQLSPVILNSGGTIADVSGVVETLSSRFAAFGIAGDRARRVTNGVIQAFAKGKLQAEELTQQISEADPAFKTDFANALKVSVAGLEELVKAGKVTSDVFLKGLLEIGKTNLLFGRLGVSAVDAAESLSTTGTTVDQVRAKLATINQLSLERFAKSAEPVLFSFLRFGAVITDTISRISQLEGVKSLGSTLGNVSQSLGRVLEGLLAFVEAAASVVSVIARVVDVFARIPGVTDLVALAIASKLIAPLANLKSIFGQSVTAATGFGKAIRAVTSFSGLSEAIKGIGQQTVGASGQLEKLGAEKKRLEGSAAKAEAAILRLQKRIEGYQNVIKGQRALPDFGTNAAAQAAVDRYTKKIDRARTGIDKLGDALGRINTAQSVNAAGLDKLANQKGLATKAAGLLQGALVGVGKAGSSIINTLGPIGVALALIATLTSAYRTANESSNAILDESKQRVDALKAALNDLGASTQEQEKPVRGLTLVWEKASFVLSDLIDTLKKPFEGGAQSADQANGKTNTFLDTLGRVVQAALLGAAAGATLGTVFGGIGAAPLAAIGAVAAGLVALAAGSDDAGLKTRKLQEDLQATEIAIIAETKAIEALISGLNQINEKDLDIKTAKTIAGFNQAQTALKGVGRAVDSLKLQQEGLNTEAAKLAPEASKGIVAYKAIQVQQERVNALKRQIQDAGGWNKAPEALRKAAFAAGAELSVLKQKAEAVAKTDPGSRRYLELQTRIAQVNKTLGEAEKQYNAAQEAADNFAKANGFLTSEQKKTVPTIAGTTEKVKELQAALQTSLNPKANPEKWREITTEIAKQTVALDGLNDEVALATGKEIAIRIKAQIDSGQINNSIENARRLLGVLEQQAVLLDINSPDLPGVIRQLVDTQLKVDDLNGRRAEITIAILEAAGIGGVGSTLSGLDLYLQQLNQKKITIPIGSQGIDEVIGQIGRVSALRDAANQSSAQLERTLSQQYFSERSQQIRDEQALQNEVFNQRIERLRELTPAEQALARIREAELRARADAGDLEAQAQLERLQREKEIQSVLREQRKEDADAKAALKNISEEEKNLQKEAKKEELDAARTILSARKEGKTLLDESVQPARNVASEMRNAAIDAEKIASEIKGLDGFSATVTVKGIPARWTGGPVSAGSAYQVNELGQEGFLSAGGRLSAINKPKNALWRAPSSGTVIPAHIWSGLDVPSGGIRTTARPMPASSNGNGLQKVVRAIQASLAAPSESAAAMHEMASVQARQAIEIGKLSRAVNKLAGKDQTVNVAVRNTGSTAYLDALSRRF